MTPYFNSTSYDNVDIEEATCRSCQTPTLYLDNSQGDTVCTSCGLVQAQHYKSSIAEWRDYSAIDPDSSGRNITARAGSLVDESRWAGGLEPTALGKVYNPSGSASYNNPRLDGYRRKLGKMKRVVDRWVEKEFERQVEEGKIALKVKAKKEKQNRANNGHGNENTSGSDSGIKEEEDWTGYGTNEHEEIARQRMEEISKANKLLVSEKWSLDRALLLHGESHEIPTYYTTYNAMAGEQPKDIQKERHILNKRMDVAQRKASADLYCAHKLIQKALKKLDLFENTSFNSQVMQAICQYVDSKGGFKVKGVAAQITSEIKKDALLYEQQYQFNKQRQMSALASAIIYLECKRNGLGRAVKEICSSFEPLAKCAIERFKSEAFIKPKFLSKAINEIKALLPDYIKSITLSAVQESKEKSSSTSSSSISSTSAIASISTSASSSTALVSSAQREQIKNRIQHITKKLKLSSTASEAITKLVLHCKDNNLIDIVASKNSALIASMIYLVCDAGTTMQRLSKTALKKKIRKNMKIKKEAGKFTITKGTKDEGSDNHSSSNNNNDNNDESISTSKKRKHIRPGGGGGGCLGRSFKRQRIKQEESSFPILPLPVTSLCIDEDTDMLQPLHVASSSVAASSSTSTSTLLSPEDIKKESATASTQSSIQSLDHQTDTHTQTRTSASIMQSYHQWSLEESWHRTMGQIEQSCHTSQAIICIYYRKELYPRRKTLLDLLQVGFKEDMNTSSNDSYEDMTKANVLLSNIASVAPLMVTAKE